MKKAIFIFITIFYSTILSGQIKDDIKRLLSDHDFVSFKKYIDSCQHSHEKRGVFWWKYLRDLTEDYQEGILCFNISSSDSAHPGISFPENFVVKLIASDKKIIFHTFCEVKLKKTNNDWVNDDDTISAFKDDSSFYLLHQSFKKHYSTDLNEDELLLVNTVYGNRCGPDKADPAEKIKIDEFVRNKDKDSLIKWLQSANTEKQIYAVDGLFQLKQNGMVYTANEINRIQYVLKKKGTINACSGIIIYQSMKIQTVTKDFIF